MAILVGEPEMLPTAAEKKVFEDMTDFLLRIVDQPLKEGLTHDFAKRLFCKSRQVPTFFFAITYFSLSLPSLQSLTGLFTDSTASASGARRAQRWPSACSRS